MLYRFEDYNKHNINMLLYIIIVCCKKIIAKDIISCLLYFLSLSPMIAIKMRCASQANSEKTLFVKNSYI